MHRACEWLHSYDFKGSGNADQQGPLQSFDATDLDTAEMALLTNPDVQEPKSEGAALLSRLALQRRLTATKRWLTKVAIILHFCVQTESQKFQFIDTQGGGVSSSESCLGSSEMLKIWSC